MESVARTVTNTHSHLTWLLSAVRLTPAKAMPFQCMACSTVLVQKQCQLFIALCYTTKQEQEHEQHTPWQPFRNIQCEWYFAVIINRQNRNRYAQCDRRWINSNGNRTPEPAAAEMIFGPTLVISQYCCIAEFLELTYVQSFFFLQRKLLATTMKIFSSESEHINTMSVMQQLYTRSCICRALWTLRTHTRSYFSKAP